MIPQALAVYQEGEKRPPAGEVSDVLREAVAAHGPPRSGTKRLAVKSVLQTGTRPPTFVIKVNDGRLVHFSYRRYLENRLRAAFGFAGNPLRLVFKSSAGERK